MSLQKAINKNGQGFVEAVNTYQTDFATVQTWAVGITHIKFPAPINPPEDWSDFENAFRGALSIAYDWIFDINVPLCHIPKDIQDYNDLLVNYLTNAIQNADKLIINPADEMAKKELILDLSSMTSNFNAVTQVIENIFHKMDSYDKTSFVKIIDDFNTIITKAMNNSKIDKTKIDQIKSSITQLQEDIKNKSREMHTLPAIEIGSAIILGFLGILLGGLEGIVVVIGSCIMVALGLSTILIDEQKIQDDKDKIQHLTSSLHEYELDLLLMNKLYDDFKEMVGNISTIQTSFSNMLGEWNKMGRDIMTAVSDIHKATTSLSNLDYKDIKQDIEGALDEWNVVYKNAGNLFVNCIVNNAELSPGMSQDQVKEALKKGEEIEISEYYKKTISTFFNRPMAI